MQRKYSFIIKIIVLCCCLANCLTAFAQGRDSLNDINGHAVKTKMGLIQAPGVDLVIAHCSACHSTSLIVQNSMSRNRWLDTIRWMQETQKLWPLGESEPMILDYLSTWYGPKTTARRPPLPVHLMPLVKKQ